MGVPASTNFTTIKSDGRRNAAIRKNIVTGLGWTILQTPEGTSHLVYQNIVEDGGIVSTPTHISAPLFRFNQYSPASIGRKQHARAYDCDGIEYEMPNESSVVGTWAEEGWKAFWAKAGLDCAFETVTKSFYVPELGAEWRTPRRLIGKTVTGGLGLNHRHYNVSHLRIIVGQVPDHPALARTWIDEILGVNTEQEEIWPTGGVTIAYAMTLVPDQTDMVEVKFAIGVCSLKDRYDRKIGAKLVVDRLETFLNATDPDPHLIQVDSKGKARFIGLGRRWFRIPRSKLRPTTVAATAPYMEFCAPFFPKGKAMQIMILRHVLFKMDFEMEEETWGMAKIHGIIEATEESATYQLRQAGYRDPHKVFYPKGGTTDPRIKRIAKPAPAVSDLVAGGETAVEAYLNESPAVAPVEEFTIRPISEGSAGVTGAEYHAPI